MATSARFRASESAAMVSLNVTSAAFNSSIGGPLIEPETSRSSTQATLGSGFSANSLASKPP
jgi:hypothetical protein